MKRRFIVAVAVTLALPMSGCSSGPTPTVPTPSATAKSTSPSATSSSTPESPSDGASAPLDGDACVEVTGASLDLSVATSKDQARTAADTLEKYDPPASAKTAIEHFVTTGGAQFDDPDYSKYNGDLDNWVHAVCPV